MTDFRRPLGRLLRALNLKAGPRRRHLEALKFPSSPRCSLTTLPWPPYCLWASSSSAKMWRVSGSRDAKMDRNFLDSKKYRRLGYGSRVSLSEEGLLPRECV